MVKPVLQLAALGFVGIALWKIAGAFLLPLVFLVFKIALVIGLVMVAFWYFNKKDRKEEPPVSE